MATGSSSSSLTAASPSLSCRQPLPLLFEVGAVAERSQTRRGGVLSVACYAASWARMSGVDQSLAGRAGTPTTRWKHAAKASRKRLLVRVKVGPRARCNGRWLKMSRPARQQARQHRP